MIVVGSVVLVSMIQLIVLCIFLVMIYKLVLSLKRKRSCHTYRSNSAPEEGRYHLDLLVPYPSQPISIHYLNHYGNFTDQQVIDECATLTSITQPPARNGLAETLQLIKSILAVQIKRSHNNTGLRIHQDNDYLLSLVASIREYGGPKTSKKSIQEFFQQIEQYGRINNWTGHDLVAIAISKLTDKAALFIKGLDQPEQQDLTYDRLKELLTKRFLDRLPLQYYYTLLHEARQEKTQTPTQFLDRLRNTTAKTIRKGSTPAECTILIEDGRYGPLSALIHEC